MFEDRLQPTPDQIREVVLMNAAADEADRMMETRGRRILGRRGLLRYRPSRSAERREEREK